MRNSYLSIAIYVAQRLNITKLEDESVLELFYDKMLATLTLLPESSTVKWAVAFGGPQLSQIGTTTLAAILLSALLILYRHACKS